MSLLVVGLSHRSAPVSVLERASLAAETQAKLLQDALAAEPAAEAAVLATCNRIELYADVDKFHAGVAELSTLLAQHSGVGLDELTPYLYVHYEDRAVHHLFSVACGLDSMVVGEGQILGQIKDALALGQESHTAGRLLNDLFQQSLRVGKRAHSETGIDRAGQSLVTFGLQQLAGGADTADWAGGKRALVIGAGSMSSLAAATLARTGVAEIVVANRTRARADRLVEILGQAGGTGVTARAVEMAAVSDELTRADVVVSCTGATGLVLTGETVAGALGLPFDAAATAVEAPAVPAADLDQHAAWVENGSAATTAQAQAVRQATVPAQSTGPVRLALLDLAMPRDIDGAAARLAGVRLVDIESLAEASADAPMAADVDQVRTIVADEVAAFGAAQRAAHITPTVVALRTMAADVVAGEIARLDGRLPDLDEKQRAEITQTVRRVVDKLLHAPTVRVKQLASEPGGAGYADALRELFDLDPQTVAAVSRADLNDPNRGRS
ncbi:glutamyl-tRNA reductase [Streptomyces sp. NPDC002917]|jgi:glutamyl-tRNA reductase|uniref:glutamyl-tRNA reductase n=1 Tax=unclassified Streptomyces TaxID=2593676 RepID=UPI002DD7D557|nr:glutamyl-tRNA reductase [Streptomyces sp. NBC_01800]WSA77461.1 glutamyl-tRNA reductase [Streptomyces sp. NBC_01799]WTC81258.1 glutamyl-tRNA reductase [Streptomyces sp. NBC_01653]WTD34155.1 glutamyl-tRNA reductase [Streptomyces sp. NBC_01643]WTD89608.1 glutamyl-tRNA reductase [Streptomyces sp. NBC_01637]WSA68966.1 glutamyl-tRNA reductase [Streptomyces sp. NBC_01800]